MHCARRRGQTGTAPNPACIDFERDSSILCDERLQLDNARGRGLQSFASVSPLLAQLVTSKVLKLSTCMQCGREFAEPSGQSIDVGLCSSCSNKTANRSDDTPRPVGVGWRPAAPQTEDNRIRVPDHTFSSDVRVPDRIDNSTPRIGQPTAVGKPFRTFLRLFLCSVVAVGGCGALNFLLRILAALFLSGNYFGAAIRDSMPYFLFFLALGAVGVYVLTKNLQEPRTALFALLGGVALQILLYSISIRNRFAFAIFIAGDLVAAITLISVLLRMRHGAASEPGGSGWPRPPGADTTRGTAQTDAGQRRGRVAVEGEFRGGIEGYKEVGLRLSRIERYDASSNRLPPIPILIPRGLLMQKGFSLTEGDQIRAYGRWKKHQYVKVRRIDNLTTGITLKRRLIKMVALILGAAVLGLFLLRFLGWIR